MSDKSLARRSEIEVFFDGTNISKSLNKYLLSLTYTDQEDGVDDLQIKLADRDDIWLEKWLNDAITSASLGESAEETSTPIYYKVIAKNGVYVHSRPDTIYYVYGSMVYGTVISAKSVSNGWVNFEYSGKNAYAQLKYMQQCDGTAKNNSFNSKIKGLSIQANIICRNFYSDGKDFLLNCGQFELDNVNCSGPPSTITIKGTALPYEKSIRQTQKNKSWEKYNLSGIAEEIAENADMACMFLCSANPFYQRVEQISISDIAFLKKLCQDAGVSLKVTNNIIVIFDEASYNPEQTRVITRGDGSYTKWQLNTGEANTKYTSCQVSYTDPDTGKVISAIAYSKADNNEKGQCLKIKAKVNSKSEALMLAKQKLKMHNQYEYTVSLTFPLDPSLCNGTSVTLVGWGAWDGKYIIKTSKHTASRSGSTTQITLRRVMEET